jgi:hypothetical protein
VGHKPTMANANASHYRLRAWFRFGLGIVSFGCGDGEEVSKVILTPRVGTLTVETSVSTFDCPKVEWYSVSPFRHVAGQDVAMEVSGTTAQGAVPYYSWLATSGDFSDPTSSATIYNCGPERNPVVTATVFYLNCESSVEIPMDCT